MIFDLFERSALQFVGHWMILQMEIAKQVVYVEVSTVKALCDLNIRSKDVQTKGIDRPIAKTILRDVGGRKRDDFGAIDLIPPKQSRERQIVSHIVLNAIYE